MTDKLAPPISLGDLTPEQQKSALFIVANLVEPRPGDLLLPRYAASVRNDLDLLQIMHVDPPVVNPDGSESSGWVTVHPKGIPEQQSKMSYIAARAYRLEYLFQHSAGKLSEIAPPAKKTAKKAPQPVQEEKEVYRIVDGKKAPLKHPAALQKVTAPAVEKKDKMVDPITLDLREIAASDDKALIAYAVGKGVAKKYITELVTTAPNGGVKKMRVGNAVRNHLKGAA